MAVVFVVVALVDTDVAAAAVGDDENVVAVDFDHYKYYEMDDRNIAAADLGVAAAIAIAHAAVAVVDEIALAE